MLARNDQNLGAADALQQGQHLSSIFNNGEHIISSNSSIKASPPQHHLSFLSGRLRDNDSGLRRNPNGVRVRMVADFPSSSSNDGEKKDDVGGTIIPLDDCPPVAVSSDDDDVVATKVKGRKRRLVMGYQISSFQHLVLSLVQLVSSQVGGGAVHSLSSTSSMLYNIFGGGLFTEATILFILRGAAIHDRLSSDTYKRLSLAIIVSAVIQQLLPVGARLTFSQRLVLKGPALIALIVAMKGYGYGVLGWDKSKTTRGLFIKDLKDGIHSTVKCLMEVRMKSLGYLFGTILVGSMTVMKGWEVVSLLLSSAGGYHQGDVSMMVVSSLSRLAKLWLMTSVFFTLKDAADRDRLKGTTFVQLNFVSAAAFASMAVYYAVPIVIGKVSYWAGTALATPAFLAAIGAGAMAAFALYNGATNAVAKKGTKN